MRGAGVNSREAYRVCSLTHSRRVKADLADCYVNGSTLSLILYPHPLQSHSLCSSSPQTVGSACSLLEFGLALQLVLVCRRQQELYCIRFGPRLYVAFPTPSKQNTLACWKVKMKEFEETADRKVTLTSSPPLPFSLKKAINPS